jgi:hypothetical protein
VPSVRQADQSAGFLPFNGALRGVSGNGAVRLCEYTYEMNAADERSGGGVEVDAVWVSGFLGGMSFVWREGE